MCGARLRGVLAYRVGFAPEPWAWTPWEYAARGRFTGRWDDPDGVWRTLYLGADRLACYLEVLAFARPSRELISELAEIDVADEDADDFPTAPPGLLPRRWADPRVVATGALSGWFVRPGDVESLATLRTLFRGIALQHGLSDLDGAALRDGRSRAVTQAISQWINGLPEPSGTDPVSGIEFDSRHGDRLTLWAVYERPGDGPVSRHLTPLDSEPVAAGVPDL